MSGINWEEKMSVGIKSIDIQHKTLIESINNFYNALGHSSNKELIAELLKKMKEYSVLHFTAEESILKKFAYPDLEKHIAEHKSFISKVEDIYKRMLEGKLILSLELTSFIKSWITEHIMVVDKKYSVFLNSKGVL